MLKFLLGEAQFIPGALSIPHSRVIDEISVHCCMKCPQILREKTSSEKYTRYATHMGLLNNGTISLSNKDPH